MTFSVLGDRISLLVGGTTLIPVTWTLAGRDFRDARVRGLIWTVEWIDDVMDDVIEEGGRGVTLPMHKNSVNLAFIT